MRGWRNRPWGAKMVFSRDTAPLARSFSNTARPTANPDPLTRPERWRHQRVSGYSHGYQLSATAFTFTVKLCLFSQGPTASAIVATSAPPVAGHWTRVANADPPTSLGFCQRRPRGVDLFFCRMDVMTLHQQPRMRRRSIMHSRSGWRRNAPSPPLAVVNRPGTTHCHRTDQRG